MVTLIFSQVSAAYWFNSPVRWSTKVHSSSQIATCNMRFSPFGLPLYFETMITFPIFKNSLRETAWLSVAITEERPHAAVRACVKSLIWATVVPIWGTFGDCGALLPPDWIWYSPGEVFLCRFLQVCFSHPFTLCSQQSSGCGSIGSSTSSRIITEMQANSNRRHRGL